MPFNADECNNVEVYNDCAANAQPIAVFPPGMTTQDIIDSLSRNDLLGNPPIGKHWNELHTANSSEKGIISIFYTGAVTVPNGSKVIVVATKIPAAANAETSSSSFTDRPTLNALEHCCKKAGIDVKESILDRIRKSTGLRDQLFLCRADREFTELYKFATLLMGSSTRDCIVAKDSLGLRINGVYAKAHSRSSIFYEAYLAGAPRLLKLPNKASDAQQEFDVYSAVPNTHKGKQCLVEVTLVSLAVSSSAHHLPSDTALLMRYFHTTLFSIPYEVAGMHKQLLNAATRVSSAIDALHSGGYVHCDVKPDNILLDASTDNYFLADYDAAVKMEQLVERTTDAYLSAEYLALRLDKMLSATKAVDYAMLAFTLAERCGLLASASSSSVSSPSSSSSSVHSKELFFKLPAFNRTVPAIRSSVSAELLRCQTMLRAEHSMLTAFLQTDMQHRCELLQQIDNMAQKVQDLDSKTLWAERSRVLAQLHRNQQAVPVSFQWK